MYADRITKSIEKTLLITRERRAVQEAYNTEHGIIPHTVKRQVIEDLAQTFGEVVQTLKEEGDNVSSHLTREEVTEKIEEYEKEMKLAAKELRFEDATHFRDLLRHYQELLLID